MAVRQLGAAENNGADATTKNYVDSKLSGNVKAATTAIGTTITSISDISATVPSGNGDYEFYMYVPIVTVGTVTTLTLTLSPAGAPTTSVAEFNVYRAVAAGALTHVIRFNTFNSAQTVFSGLAAGTYLLQVKGSIISSTSGLISLSMTRTGGTSATVQAGAYIKLERLV